MCWFQLAYGTVRLLLPTWVQDAALYVEDHVFFQRYMYMINNVRTLSSGYYYYLWCWEEWRWEGVRAGPMMDV